MSNLNKHIALLLIILVLGFNINGQQCNIIYVSTNGTDSGIVGTQDNPSSLYHAFSLLNTANKTIYIASGTYALDSSLYLKSNMSLVGGFDPITWEKTNGASTVLFRNTLNPDTNPSRIVAIYGDNVSDFHIQDLEINTANVFSNGTSTYGLHLNICSDYSITRCKIKPGNAANGNSGNKGTDGTHGGDGIDGEDGDETNEPGICCRLGGLGGNGSFAGSNAGGNGGNGGETGFYISPAGGDAYNGYPGGAAGGAGGGQGGQGGNKIVVTVYDPNCVRTLVNDGQGGYDGVDGNVGTDGGAGSNAFNALYYIPGNGLSGTAGTNGYGGGGGGGGGSLGGVIHDWPFSGFPDNKNGTGAGGGGGGEGGESGLGGSGGQGGGASFGVFLSNNGTNSFVYDCQIFAGSYGLGGNGGLGGAGGQGGQGGDGGGQINCNIGAGGDGGQGGNGGQGGQGGKGADGISEDIYEINTSNSINIYNIYTLQQPIVSVKSGGCANYPIYFETSASGNLQWFFGAGSSPSSATGQIQKVEYGTTGKKTFTLVNNGIAYTYTNFIDMVQSGSGGHPQINSLDSILCMGNSGSYATGQMADDYVWQIIGPDSTDTIQGPTAFQVSNYSFDSLGSYEVVLQTYDSCCGFSYPDTFSVIVNSILKPVVNISADDSDLIICSGEDITFLANDSIAGNSPSFQWRINALPVIGSGSMYSSNSLLDGSVVDCIITSSQQCSNTLTDTSNSFSITVIDAPVINCGADSFELGKPTHLNASVSSGGLPPFDFSWDFGDSTTGNGDSLLHMYPTIGSYAYSVVVTDSNGCTGSCQGILSIITNLSASFEADTLSGCAPLLVGFSNYSTNAVSYFWDFGDGGNSYLADPAHDFVLPGVYDIMLKAYGGAGNDSVQVFSQVVVHPSPVANFQAFPQSISSSGDSVHFADNSIGANSWFWGFGDPGSGAQNSSSIQNPVHYYSSNGVYSVSLEVGNQYDCKDSVIKPDFITIDLNASLHELIKGNVDIYPVPFKDELTLSFRDNLNPELQGRILNIKGQTMIRLDMNQNINVSTSSFMPGIYFIVLSYKDSLFTQKIIKY